jgi:hypothetical protein
MARTVEAMRRGRKRYIERRHAFGLKAPGGRPGRISYRLRRAVIEEAEQDLAGFDLEAIRTGAPLIDEMTETEELADMERYGVVLLLDELRLPVGTKNRNRAAIRLAYSLAGIRFERVERRDRERCHLDELIEDLALS